MQKILVLLLGFVVVTALVISGANQALTMPEEKPEAVKVAKTPEALVVAGQKLFVAQCASCHGEGGKGDGVAAEVLDPKPRDLTDGEYVGSLTDEYMIKLLKGGGPAVEKSPLMPPLGAAMTEEQLGSVIAFVRSLSAEKPETKEAVKEQEAAKSD